MHLKDEDDLPKIFEEIHSIKSRFYDLGRSLNLRIQDLRKIRNENPSESDALEDVLLLWLEKKYNVERQGPPTWRMLVEAVDQETGGNDHELAKRIASKHQTGRKLHAIATVSNQPLALSEVL